MFIFIKLGVNSLALDVTSTLCLLISYHQQHRGSNTSEVGGANALVVDNKIYCVYRELSVIGLKLLKFLTTVFLKNQVFWDIVQC
jgi:hypothetical protein